VGELRVMDGMGDTRLMWDPNNAEEVSNARRTFNDLTKKGHIAYEVKRKGGVGERIRTFDPEMSKVILTPQLVGG